MLDQKQKGLVIITASAQSEWEKKLLVDFNLPSIIDKHTATDVLYLNLEGTDATLVEIKEKIQYFASSHAEINIISAAHGFHVLPFARHETHIGVMVKNSPVLTYLHSLGNWLIEPIFSNAYRKYIPTEDYLKAITEAVGNKPIKFWHSSCQASQIIETATKILPEGSVYITESHGYSTAPAALLMAVREILYSSKPFDMGELLLDYAYYADYHNHFNINPHVTKIGQGTVNMASKTTEFITAFKNGQISDEQWNLIKNKYNQIGGQIGGQKDQDKYSKVDDFGVTKKGDICVSNTGTSNYLAVQAYELFAYLVQMTQVYDPWAQYNFQDKICIPNVLGEIAYPEAELFTPTADINYCPSEVSFS